MQKPFNQVVRDLPNTRWHAAGRAFPKPCRQALTPDAPGSQVRLQTLECVAEADQRQRPNSEPFWKMPKMSPLECFCLAQTRNSRRAGAAVRGDLRSSERKLEQWALASGGPMQSARCDYRHKQNDKALVITMQVGWLNRHIREANLNPH